MNIALIGFGSMGEKVKEIAEERKHNIKIIVDPQDSRSTHADISKADFKNIDVAIDFSSTAGVVKNINALIEKKVAIVVGTTGWYEYLPEIKKQIIENNVGFLWSANFSIGVNVYYRVVAEAARLINNFSEYDVWGHEIHHNQKIDSPSGTAKKLEEILLKNIKRKTKIVEDRLNRKIEPEEIHFSSTRGGPVNFSHTIGLDSAADTITITHSARDRSGYALGAVKAAEWLRNKHGFYSMDDFIQI
jgi:4-hydroxy-tetrahydrodipicolinate reductase